MFLLAAVSAFGSSRGESRIAEAEKDTVATYEPPTGTAVLDHGPDLEEGILFLPPNVIPFYGGGYIDGPWSIEVFYTESDVYLSEDWIPGICGAIAVSVIKDAEKIRYFHFSEEGWSVFFSFPSRHTTSCKFIARFLQRLRFFKSAAKARGIVPFPAVVDYSP